MDEPLRAVKMSDTSNSRDVSSYSTNPQRPFFEYTEEFGGGSTYHGYSEGGGYFSTTTARPSSSAAFVVVKHRDLSAVFVWIQSPELKWFIEEATGKLSLGTLVETFALEPSCGILQYYWRFMVLFWQLEYNVEWTRFMPFIRLFIQGFLVEKGIWESFNLGQLCQDGRLDTSHWQEMQGLSIGRHIDDCESLLKPKNIDDYERPFETKNTEQKIMRSTANGPDSFYPLAPLAITIKDYYTPLELGSAGFIFPQVDNHFQGDRPIQEEIQDYFESNLESLKAAAAVGDLSALSHFLYRPRSIHPGPEGWLAPVFHGLWYYVDNHRLVCPPNVLDDLYSSAARNGRKEVIKWLMNTFHVRPSRSVADIAAYLGQQKVLDYLAAISVYGTPGCQSRRGLQVRLKTRGRWEQRRAIQETVRKAFHTEHQAFLHKSIGWNASTFLSNFAESLLEPERVWRKGFQTIRNLLGNQMPSDLQDIFGCVQVSRAMRASLVENVDSYDSADKSQIYPDLVRWRCAVAEIDHDLFDEIVASVWCQNLSSSILQDNWRLCDEALLEHFRGYFENLIAATRAACVYSDDEIYSGGTRRLCDIQDDFASVPDESDSGSPETSSTAHNPAALTPDFIAQPQHQDHEIIARPMIILLTATTIFMIIVAFFIVLRHLSTGPTFILSMLQQASKGDLRDYCYLLLIFLGSSTGDTHCFSSYRTHETTSSNDEPMAQGASPSEQVDVSQIPLIPEEQLQTSLADEKLEPQGLTSSSFSNNVDNPDYRQIGAFTPATDYTAAGSSSYSDRKQCSHCFSTFSSVSNLGKHMRTDCKATHNKQRFLCGNPGCGKILTRKEYRDKHQRDKCYFRPYES